MEMEWLDVNVPIVGPAGDTQIDPSELFTSDEPPLPLAYDTWSRGALEVYPEDKKESIVVLDPFLREKSSSTKSFERAGGDGFSNEENYEEESYSQTQFFEVETAFEENIAE